MGQPEGAVVREDLELVEAVPARPVDEPEEARNVGHAVAGQEAVGEAARRLTDVGDMDADNAVAVRIEVGLASESLRCHVSKRSRRCPQPRPSSISAAASPIVLTIVHCSPSNRL